MGNEETDSRVVVVEDEEDLADAYGSVLEVEYDVDVAYSGEEGLEMVSDDVDVVLLDRRMPGLSGSEVLKALRESGFDGSVAMVTAVDPDFDIIEMGFDDYILKPIDSEDLLETVDHLINMSGLEEEIRDYVSKTVKQATLESMKGSPRLDKSREFEELKEEVKEKSSEIGDISSSMSQEEFEYLLTNVIDKMEYTNGFSR